MKKRFSEGQVIGFSGIAVKDLCNSMSSPKQLLPVAEQIRGRRTQSG
ncbi:MAG: hypothetical protein OJF51_003801 [Nitrospira sp.]|jgi:hypothetical protein|nr:MAG: hypothetical protein OJF51_003801 [Nitrospira sp.]